MAPSELLVAEEWDEGGFWFSLSRDSLFSAPRVVHKALRHPKALANNSRLFLQKGRSETHRYSVLFARQFL